MEITKAYICMRCGNEYTAAYTKDGKLVERTCPKCRSNSIRIVKEDTPAKT